MDHKLIDSGLVQKYWNKLYHHHRIHLDLGFTDHHGQIVDWPRTEIDCWTLALTNTGIRSGSIDTIRIWIANMIISWEWNLKNTFAGDQASVYCANPYTTFALVYVITSVSNFNKSFFTDAFECHFVRQCSLCSCLSDLAMRISLTGIWKTWISLKMIPFAFFSIA